MAAMPSWYVTPQGQVQTLLRLFPRVQPSAIPAAPRSFTQRTPTEVPLLAAYFPKKSFHTGLERTFDIWWNHITPPADFPKYRDRDLESDGNHLRLAPHHVHVPGIRWVAFDHRGYTWSPESALGLAIEKGRRLAGTEVLMAATLFPQWISSWRGDGSAPFPQMSGLQCYNKRESSWSDVPCLRPIRFGPLMTHANSIGQLMMYAICGRPHGVEWSSSLVRVC